MPEWLPTSHNTEVVPQNEAQKPAETEGGRTQAMEDAAKEEKEVLTHNHNTEQVLHPNPHINALLHDVRQAEARLQQALTDMNGRKDSPAYQQAQRLHANGISVEYVFGHEEQESEIVALRYRLRDGSLRESHISGAVLDTSGQLNLQDAYIYHNEFIGEEPTYNTLAGEEIRQSNIMSDLDLDSNEDRLQIIEELSRL